MKSWSGLSAFVLFLWFCPQPQTSQPQNVQVTLNDLSWTTCRVRKTDFYDYDVSMAFVVKNLSEQPLLVANEIRVVTSESIATSEENAKHEIFITTIKEEYQPGERTVKEATFKDFTVLKPGEARVIKFTRLIFFSSTGPQKSNGMILPQGRNWVVLGFSLLPEYFMFNSAEQLRTKWKSIGQLDSKIVRTEPFPIDIAIRPNSPKCETR
jgi:hypothetical protein